MKERKIENPVVGVYWDCDVKGRAGETRGNERVAGNTLIVELWELGEHVGCYVPECFGAGHCTEEAYHSGVW